MEGDKEERSGIILSNRFLWVTISRANVVSARAHELVPPLLEEVSHNGIFHIRELCRDPCPVLRAAMKITSPEHEMWLATQIC